MGGMSIRDRARWIEFVTLFERLGMCRVEVAQRLSCPVRSISAWLDGGDEHVFKAPTSQMIAVMRSLADEAQAHQVAA